jgi:hypothetical protein
MQVKILINASKFLQKVGFIIVSGIVSKTQLPG